VLRNSIVVLGVGLLAGTSIAYGQTPKPTLVAQAPITVPPSGVLVTPPLAPVAVPPSGVLVTQPSLETHTVATAPAKMTQRVRIAETTAPTSMRHVVHRRTGARGVITRTTVRESIVAAPAVATTAAAAPINIVPRYYNFVTPPASLGLRAQLTTRRAAPVVSTAAPAVATTPMPTYRYIYEPDRILVIDPSSDIVVQAIPR
jgi:hypothetical protein